MSEEGFKKLLVFLADKLDESKDLLMLVQKRYDECDDLFRTSAEFKILVDDTQSKIEVEKHRIFVHLKDFLTKLKSHRVESGKRKRKLNKLDNNLAKRLCAGNSCSDLSSDSDFFKKIKNKNSNNNDNIKEDLSSLKSGSSPNNISTRNSPSPPIVKQKSVNDKVEMGRSSDKPWAISDESLSMDSVRSDTKSSDNSDLYSNSKFSQEPESPSVDSVSSESKGSQLTLPSSNRLSLNKQTDKSSSKSSLASTTQAKSTTENSGSHISPKPAPEMHVVIDDDDSYSNLSLPSPEGDIEIKVEIPAKNNSSIRNKEVDDSKDVIDDVASNEKVVEDAGSAEDEGVVEEAGSDEVVEEACSVEEDEIVEDESATNIEKVKAVENNVNTEAEAKDVAHAVKTDAVESQKKKKGSERQIKRLEKLLGDIRTEIENVTKKELSIDEMEADDSAYVYEDRLQKKFVKVWEKLCELKGQDATTGRPIEKKFRFSGTRYNEINRRIEKFINKKKIFPDYNDIKKIVIQVNTHYELYLGKSAIDDLAREAFTDVGNQLQDRRHKNFILTFGNSQTEVSSIAEDPALYNTELRKKLEDNRKLAKNRLDEIISKYANKQYETNAQPEEVDENAIDSSSDEEEEEEAQDIPELDEVMALSDGDEDEISEIPGTSSSSLNTSLTKNLKIQIEKLAVPSFLQKKNCVSLSNTASSTSSPSSEMSSSQNVRHKNALTSATKLDTGSKSVPSRRANKANSVQLASRKSCNNVPNSKTALNEIVIDLDSSSDADDITEVISRPQPQILQQQHQKALVPAMVRTRFPTNIVHTQSSTKTTFITSTSTMVMNTQQNNRQFSMQVKTGHQQQQHQDGFSLKIASVSSLAYSIKDHNRNTQYITSQQSNFQNQDFKLVSGTNYKQNSNKASLPNSVIVLSDSD